MLSGSLHEQLKLPDLFVKHPDFDRNLGPVPSSRQAQACALEALGLVDGVVTEDSDAFVFGGKKVYKNIFDDQKYVEAYVASDAERDLGLGHNHMIALAMLLGGDYTEGVKGVGA